MKTLEIGKTFQLSMECFFNEVNSPIHSNTYGQALSIVKNAMGFRNRDIHIKKAKEAISICNECVEAYILYASALDDLFARIEVLQRGYECVVLGLGKNFFLQECDDYYADERSHNYFKIRYAYALCLFECGFYKESLQHFEQILNLNPSDVYKVREHLYILYIYYEEVTLLNALLERFKDRNTLYVYILFILEIKRKNFVKAKKIIPLLKEVNESLFSIITHQRIFVGKANRNALKGSEEEAGYVYSLLNLILHIIEPLQTFITMNI